MVTNCDKTKLPIIISDMIILIAEALFTRNLEIVPIINGAEI